MGTKTRPAEPKCAVGAWGRVSALAPYPSRQDYDNAVAADLQARAAVETAHINLVYTKVLSPIPGRISRSAVTEGALVTANQANALATVQELDPVYVDVTQLMEPLSQQVPGRTAAALKAHHA